MNINYDSPFNFKPIPAITPLDGYWQNGTWKFNMSEINAGAASQPSWIDIILKGNTALTLVNAKADGLNYLKLFGDTEQLAEPYLDTVTLSGGCEQRNLPEGYTQYEYLRSSGTQYIDLGYKGKANTKVEIKFKYYQTSSATGSGRVFGSRSTSISNAFAIGTSSGVVASTGNKIFWCYDGQSFFVPDNTFNLDEWQTVVFSATEHKINGTTEGDDYTVTTFETPSNLMLFAFDNNGTIGCGYVDIAYCKLWDDDGTLVRDVVPGGNGTTYGMYDKVSNTLLTNAGTGTFTAGPVAVPTPDTPIDIVCNNGAIRAGNIYNFATNSALFNANNGNGWYINTIDSYLGLGGSSNNATWAIPCLPNTDYTISYVKGNISNTILRFGWITSPDLSFVNTDTTLPCTYVLGVDDGTRFTATIKTGSQATYIIAQVGSTSYYQGDIRSVLNLVVGNEIGSIYADGTTETVTGQPLTIQAGTNIVEITQASMDNLELEVSYKAGVAVTITEIENAQLDNSVEVTING